MNQLPIGLYIHVPFCAGKCPYCDFYSLSPSPDQVHRYERRMTDLLAIWGRCGRPLSTVYFGGGTPSLLGAARLGRLLQAASSAFDVLPGAEITCEANPTGVCSGFFQELHAAGFNRISMGMQSANQDELRLLGRKHNPEQVALAVESARSAGFQNISLDLMLALPHSSGENLLSSISFAAGLQVEHISSYILKVEPGTPFAAQGIAPLEDEGAAQQYLLCVNTLKDLGYCQYEISNFARPGYESRHNLIYWSCQEYLGLGPGAHSFYGGRRFHFPPDLQAFILGGDTIDDGPGGDMEEFSMLNLRLRRGLLLDDLQRRYGSQAQTYFSQVMKRAQKCPPGLIEMANGRISLTPEGFLVSNALLSRIL